jgi:hypothetical protein
MVMGSQRNRMPAELSPYGEGAPPGGKEAFEFRAFAPLRQEHVLGPALPDSTAQAEQMGNRPPPSRSSDSVKIALLRGPLLYGPSLEKSLPQHSAAYLHHTRIMIFGGHRHNRAERATGVSDSAKLQRFLRSEPTIPIDGATRSCVDGASPSGEHR